jgi:hypothetical protein
MQSGAQSARQAASGSGAATVGRIPWRVCRYAPRLRYAFLAVAAVGVGYAITIAGIALSGGTPSTPWLAIPPSDYFKWEALFVTPVTVLCWVLAAAVVYLLSRLVGGVGTYEDTLTKLGFAVAAATLITLVPDALRAALTTAGGLSRAAWEQAVARPGSPDFVFLWTDMLAYLVGLLVLFTLAATRAGRLHGWRAAGVGLSGVLVYQGVYLIFIR